jgi:hypothetical protein
VLNLKMQNYATECVLLSKKKKRQVSNESDRVCVEFIRSRECDEVESSQKKRVCVCDGKDRMHCKRPFGTVSNQSPSAIFEPRGAQRE